ncbi:MAG: hypothetical protein ABIH49_01275 [archaeon]
MRARYRIMGARYQMPKFNSQEEFLEKTKRTGRCHMEDADRYLNLINCFRPRYGLLYLTYTDDEGNPIDFLQERGSPFLSIVGLTE